MEITHVDMEAPFYHLGNVSVFTIKARKMQYSRQPISALDAADELETELEDILTDEDKQNNDTANINNHVDAYDVVDESENSPFD